MEKFLTPPLARRAIAASICLFCLLLPLSIAGANVSWGVLLASLLLYAARGGAIAWRARHSALEKPLWIYLGIALLTATLGIHPTHSLGYLHQDAHKVWLYLLFSVALATEPAPKALYCLSVGFAIAALTGIGQTLGSIASGNVSVDASLIRAHAFVHPVTFGEQMSLGLLGTICFLIKPEGTIKNRRERLAAWTLLILTGTSLIFSNTRAAILAFLGGFAAISCIIPKLRRPLLIALPILLAAFLAADKIRYERSLLSEVLQWREKGIASSQGQLMRLTLWRIAWRMGFDHPWTGVGPNNYRTAFKQYFVGKLDGGETTWGTAHNLYLHHFAERGLLGLGALMLLLWVFWARALQRARQVPSAWNLWAFGAATSFLIMNCTEVALQTEILWILVFFIWIQSETRHRLFSRS